MDKNIVNELEYFGRVCQILDSMYSNLQQTQVWRPPTDIYETNTAIIVKIEIAGMSGDGIKLSFVNNVLNISGHRTDEEAKLTYHCLEIPYGKFHVRILIPGKYIETEVEAKYENGYLYITLPKAEEQASI
jgi:HSP20 family protein